MTTIASGWTKTLADDQQSWDEYPHIVWDAVPVVDLALYDVLAQCLQIEGIAAAEHRGKPAIRLDVNNVAAGGKGRIVLTTDQVVSDVKRYEGETVDTAGTILARADAARRALLNRTPGQREGTTGYDFAVAARAYVHAMESDDAYEDDEQRMFSLLCGTTERYTEMIGPVDDRSIQGVLDVIGENLLSDEYQRRRSDRVGSARRTALGARIRQLLEDTDRRASGSDDPLFTEYASEVRGLLRDAERELRGR